MAFNNNEIQKITGHNSTNPKVAVQWFNQALLMPELFSKVLPVGEGFAVREPFGLEFLSKFLLV